VKKPLSGTTDYLCAGPLAAPGEIDGANFQILKSCTPGTAVCSKAAAQYRKETGCTLECQATLTDKGPRGKLCAEILSELECDKTAVPCDIGSTGAGPLSEKIIESFQEG
jgi:hypothetical protein